MASIRYYLDLRRKKNSGKYPIRLYVKHKNRIIIATDFDCAKENWTGNEFSKNESNYQTKNSMLRELMRKIEMKLLELDTSNRLPGMSDNNLKNQIVSLISFKDPVTKNFIYYLDEFVSLKNNIGTKSIYQTTRNKIVEFDAKCAFETMDKKWLTAFENWMAETMKINAYAIHLRNIRAVFNYALDEEITALYPFRKFKIKKEETRKRSFTSEQLITLRDYPCEEYQRKYRDIFILMFYLIGINAVDLFYAKLNSIVNGRLEYKRAKTGKLYSIKIEPEAIKLIEKYKGENWLINIRDTYKDYKDFVRRMDSRLKQIGECKRVGLGGKKVITPLFPDISSYWARHTWATIAASLDIPKETISAALGHEIGSKITSIYIDFNRKKVDEANRKVIDYINQK